MKKRLVILLSALVFSCGTFSQENNKINGSKLFEELFAKVEANSSGDLCVKTKEFGGGFLIIIDGSEGIPSVPNQTYCAKKSIIFVRKSGWSLEFFKKKNGHWNVEHESINRARTDINKSKGEFLIENNRTLKQID